jgi:transposase
MVMKVYSPEFKADAVALYLSDPSHTFEGIGKDLGISRETLRNWVRAERARHDGGSTTSTSTEKNTVDSPPTAEELQAENEALRRELAAVRKENQKPVRRRRPARTRSPPEQGRVRVNGGDRHRQASRAGHPLLVSHSARTAAWLWSTSLVAVNSMSLSCAARSCR